MFNNVELSASRGNINSCIEVAAQNGLGLEIMAFAFPDVLDGDYVDELKHYKDLLRNVQGPLTLHGPFLDMVSGSPDPRINAVCSSRYSHAIRIAAELGASQIVFHANFIGSLHNNFYREGWHKRNVEFWGPMAEYAHMHGVLIAMENMWEFDPNIIADLLTEVDHPSLRACLDVGHAHLFTDQSFVWEDWVTTMSPWLIEFHMNNNNGIIDEHHAFDWELGVLNYHDLLPRLRAQFPDAKFVLEMDRVEDMTDSLHYFTHQMA